MSLSTTCNSSLTVFVHASLDALLETTRSTLVAMRLVYLTSGVALVLANVLAVASYRALEEPGAPIVSIDTNVNNTRHSNTNTEQKQTKQMGCFTENNQSCPLEGG